MTWKANTFSPFAGVALALSVHDPADAGLQQPSRAAVSHPMSEAVTIADLHKSFGALKVLAGVSPRRRGGRGRRHYWPVGLRQEYVAQLH